MGAEKDPDAVIIKLDNMNDHLKLVPLLLERFEAKKSKDSHVFMFVKELLKKTESVLGRGMWGPGHHGRQLPKNEAAGHRQADRVEREKEVQEEVQERKTRAEE